jgi:ABC-type long-subunit fatty acid transport system fused permease/ATPase subunit
MTSQWKDDCYEKWMALTITNYSTLVQLGDIYKYLYWFEDLIEYAKKNNCKSISS